MAPDPQFRWDSQGWVGTDYDKLWIKSQGTFSNGTLDDGQHQFLYDRAVTTYFDVQAGLRSNLRFTAGAQLGRSSVSRVSHPIFSISN